MPRTRLFAVLSLFLFVTAARAADSHPGLSVVPVIASTAGAGGSQFETSLQMSNPTEATMSGTLLVRGATDHRTIWYVVGPHQTFSYPNFMEHVGLTGGASLDILPLAGAAPRVIARIYDTSFSSAASGGVVEQVAAADALQPGERAILLGGSDAAAARTNIGIRALGDGAEIELTLYRADGSVGGSVVRAYAPNQLAQERLSGMFGVDAMADDSVIVRVAGGSAIAYSSTVNNVTHETSCTIATRVEE